VRRRDFVACLCGVLAAPLARAQPRKGVFRVGYVVGVTPLANLQGPEPPHLVTRGFIDEMRALGYEEGRNLVIERRSAEGIPGRFAGYFREFVRLEVDVIVSPGFQEIPEALKATRTVPIVIYSMVEPVERGWIASLARPGGNVTGTTIGSGAENEAKRLQLLKEVLPSASRIAYLASAAVIGQEQGKAARAAAKSLGVELVHVRHRATDLPATFAGLREARPQAVLASQSGETYAQRWQIVAFMREARLPAMYPYPEMVDLGGLMAYGNYTSKLGRDAARYVDRILKGEKPANMPVERPTKFEFVINLKTAKALDLTIPPALLLRADRVIE